MCQACWWYFRSPTGLMPPSIGIYFKRFFSIKKMKHPVPSRGQQSPGQNTWMYFECFLHHCPHFIIQCPKKYSVWIQLVLFCHAPHFHVTNKWTRWYPKIQIPHWTAERCSASHGPASFGVLEMKTSRLRAVGHNAVGREITGHFWF